MTVQLNLIAFLLFVGCQNPNVNESYESNPSTGSEQSGIKTSIQPDKIFVEDEYFINFFLKDNSYDSIAKFKIDTETKLGIYCLALLQEGQYRKVDSLLGKYKPSKFKRTYDYSLVPIFNSSLNEYISLAILRLYQSAYGYTISDIEQLYFENLSVEDHYKNIESSKAFDLELKIFNILARYNESAQGQFLFDKKIEECILLLPSPHYKRGLALIGVLKIISNGFEIGEVVKLNNLGLLDEQLLRTLIELAGQKLSEYRKQLINLVAFYSSKYSGCVSENLRIKYLEDKFDNSFREMAQKCVELKNADSLTGNVYMTLYYFNHKIWDSVSASIKKHNELNSSYVRTYLAKSLKEREIEMFELIELRYLFYHKKYKDFTIRLEKIKINKLLNYYKSNNFSLDIFKASKNIYMLNGNSPETFDDFFKNTPQLHSLSAL